ncbi:hypothetical protein PINS_up015749 [Pythium insidiosum]|nr:hypothetical protein PINS_up015749 [Pythium insidiosum]
MVAIAIDVHDDVIFALSPNGSTAYLPLNASYPSSAGPYQSISSDGTFVCASKTKTDTVYCVEKSQETWHPIGGRLRQVVVRDGRLYGVARNGSLWTTALKAISTDNEDELERLEAEEKAVEGELPALKPLVVVRSPFVSLPFGGTLNQISFDGVQLCGVTPSNAVSCVTTSSQDWREINKPLKSISPERNVIWAIDMDDNIVWSFANDTETWHTVSKDVKASFAVRVASDGKTVCVLETAGDGYCAKKDISTSPDWIPLGTSLKDIGVANGTTYGITATSGLYFSSPSAFSPVNQTIFAIASDGQYLCVSKPATYEVLCTGHGQTAWRSIGGNLTQLSIADGYLFGLARDGSLWAATLAMVSEEDATGFETGPLPLFAGNESSNSGGLSTGGIVAMVIGGVLVLAISAFIVLRLRHRRSQKEGSGSISPMAFSDPRRSHATLLTPTTLSTGIATNTSTLSQEFLLTEWTRDEMMLAMQIPLRQIEFHDQISRGAFGDIYRGVYDSRVVAIKRLSVDRRRDLHEIAKLAQEARFLMRLQHERIVEFIGVAWNAPSDLCIVTEFVLGGDLLSWLQSCRSENRAEGFSSEKLKIALHVAHALTYLHSLQPIVLHRDLKSKNILLTEKGDAKLTDFGVSRELEDATMTAGVGSSLWMAPEVIQGERYDEKADVYSFGVVLSELDTNELPFARVRASSLSRSLSIDADRLPEVAILQLVTMGKVAPRFTVDETSEMYALARACVSLDPDQRPSAAEALHRIHRVVMAAAETD